jgi:L-cysteine:1D-myo-inositol 2-amino-2-deoxy-alpha-D-glucopyranoside ligase
LPLAERRLARWRAAAALAAGPDSGQLRERLRERLADDLDTVAAIAAIDRWADSALDRPGDRDEPGAGIAVGQAVDALLGIRL